MPILFIHGVAVREARDPDWAAVRRVTRGIRWPDIRAALREHLAPTLSADAPGDVHVDWVYWGDLGVRASQLTAPPADPDERPPSALTVGVLGERLEAHLRSGTPVARWPEVIRAAWSVARDQNLRLIASDLPGERQWAFLTAAARARVPTLPARRDPRPELTAGFQLQRRRNVARAMLTVRRPLEAFVPVFLGDVMAYLDSRGQPARPGPIPRRVLAALQTAHAARLTPDEPLVVLTHSMGGQLLYDALTAFLPADPQGRGVRVDFWCAAGSQVGLFGELGLFLEGHHAPPLALPDSPHLGYFWNVWSDSDLLSFRAAGIVPGAHDTAFPLGGRLQSDHLAYLHHPDFYRTLAAKVAVHTSP